MSLESDLYAVLQTICPRVYPDVAPAGTARPYIVWQQIGGEAVSYTDNEVPSLRNAYVQVSAWAESRLQASLMAQQIEAALIASPTLAARPQSAMQAAYSEDTELRGAMQDFTIWADR